MTSILSNRVKRFEQGDGKANGDGWLARYLADIRDLQAG